MDIFERDGWYKFHINKNKPLADSQNISSNHPPMEQYVILKIMKIMKIMKLVIYFF